ncbi:MAG: hypothetical protein ABIM99_03490 [Candidatus Dojkabacteria bacterium]
MKKTRNALIILLLLIASPLSVYALDAGTSDFGLDAITIPFFPVFGTINSKYATVLTWITYAADIIIILIIVFWIARILIAGLEAIRSEGDQEKLQEAFKKLQSNLVGIGITFLIPIILTVIGFVLGIGSIFNWPKMFSGCKDETYDYYFKAYFNAPAGEDPTAFASSVCGLDSAN